MKSDCGNRRHLGDSRSWHCSDRVCAMMVRTINLCRQFVIFLNPSGKVMVHSSQPTDVIIDGKLFLDTGDLVGQVLGRAQGDIMDASWEAEKYRTIHEVHEL